MTSKKISSARHNMHAHRPRNLHILVFIRNKCDAFCGAVTAAENDVGIFRVVDIWHFDLKIRHSGVAGILSRRPRASFDMPLMIPAAKQ